MDALRVTFLSHASHLGGAERTLLDLIEGLGGTVSASAILPRSGELSAALDALGVPWVACRHLGRLQRTGALSLRVRESASLVRGSLEIARRIGERPPQILHANSTTAALFGLLAARRRRVPLVWHVRDLAPLGKWSTALGSRCSRIVAISGCVQASVRARFADARVVRISNGIDPERFRPGPARLATGEGALVVSIGQLVPWKRHELLVRAAPEVLRRFPGTRFLIVGEEPQGSTRGYRRELEQEVTQHGLEASIVLAGARRDVPEILARADLLVHTAHPEPFGRAVVEAMAAGVPVVAMAGDHGPAEIIRDGVDGLLVHPGTPAALAAAVCHLLERPGLRSEMGAAALRRARTSFHRRTMAERVRSLYDEILDEPALAGPLARRA